MAEETLSRYTPRQIADAIACAVIDADEDWERESIDLDPKYHSLCLANAVLDVLRDMKVRFVDGTGDYWGGK